MKHPKGITIRTAKVSDLKKLIFFFIKAYGSQTVFQNKNFLLYYFTSPYLNDTFSSSIIGVDSNSNIVSHYGGINYKTKIGKDVKLITWGVNAFTLPEWRGKGINSKIVQYLMAKNEFNAAIGMTKDTVSFYQKMKYNVFNNKRLSRYVYAFKNDINDLVYQIGQDQLRAYEILSIKTPEKINPEKYSIIELTQTNFVNYKFELDTEVFATTYRDKTFLEWRIFKNPFIDYKVWGILKKEKIVSYIVSREENLKPTKYRVNRIIDLFGEKEGVSFLLKHILNFSYLKDYLYVDFSAIGKLYYKELILEGFIRLENEDACLLPMVSSPIESRPNNEYLVIGSNNNQELINKLSEENVYFTRIDSDRDRINKIVPSNLIKQSLI